MTNNKDEYFIFTDADGKETYRILKDSPEGRRLAQEIKEQVALQKIVDAATEGHPNF